ncbi:MAG: TrkH family potassium uptake protein [Deltaproteobacteria bacterium]|nr:TrkH family potassium uptake protein [Deltaproteobacteria bacterium]
MTPRPLAKMSPAMLLVLSYALLILVGAFLLWLPWSSRGAGVSPLDALFTSTSAVCVTGLTVVDTGGQFSFWGQLVILALMQLGGLGIMTVSVALFAFLGRRVPFRQRLAMQDVFAHTPRRDIYSLVYSVVIFTFVTEGLGAALLFVHFHRTFPWAEALYQAVFHAVSAFCNAGFSLFAQSFMADRSSLLLNFTICGLIVLGGIGFPVVFELYQRLRNRQTHRRLSLQTKVVGLTTLVLILSGSALFYLLEGFGMGKTPEGPDLWLVSLFQSVTCRTAGFNTVDLTTLGTTTLSFMVFLMFFGASPGSCGGGIKTTTLAILGMYSLSRLRGRQRVNLYKKTLPREVVSKSISLFVLSVGIVGVGVFLILLAQEFSANPLGPPRPFLAYLFEVVSAFGTVGLSLGVTPTLDGGAKILVIALMLIGRMGVPTFSYLLLGGDRNQDIEYAEERMMVG